MQKVSNDESETYEHDHKGPPKVVSLKLVLDFDTKAKRNNKKHKIDDLLT